MLRNLFLGTGEPFFAGRRLAACGLIIFFVLSSCSGEPPAEGVPVTVYTLAEPGSGEVLVKQTLYCEEGENLTETAINAAVRGDAFPPGVRAEAFSLRNGVAHVVLSTEARALSGYALTLARACMVLTLTGLEGIDEVIISISGEGEAQQSLRASDFVLDALVLVGAERSVTLFFSDAAGAHTISETRTLEMRETDTIEWYIRYMIEELMAGPRTQGLLPVIPEGTRLLSVIVEGGDCTVNLSKEFAASGTEESARMTMSCLVRSVLAQPGINSLRLLIDGQPRDDYFGIDVSGPLTVADNLWIIR